MFIDTAEIHIKAGNGGNGAVSFHREKYVAAGGPDGGDGVRGGSVFLQADRSLRTLADFKYKRKYAADNGQDGSSGKCTGKSAGDLTIKLPVGTVVKDAENVQFFVDLREDGQTFLIAKGGNGGKGNQHFATPTRQIPSFAKSGELGEEYSISFEVKMIADVGLIGFPNVGKSTILSVVTSAQPKIADYHFTTLEPNLGVVSLDQGESFVIADIPGLIEGASEGIGLGHDFLKHIERTKILLHVVDIAGVENREPIEDFEKINEELSKYSSELAKRPMVVFGNKIDAIEDKEKADEFVRALEDKGFKVFTGSAAINEGIREAMFYLEHVLRELPDTILYDEKEVNRVYKAVEESPFEVYKEGDIFVVDGKWARRIIGSTNVDSYESLQYFQRVIKDKGVIAALEKIGVADGDTVRFYDYEFEYIK
jgi:GTPase